MHWIPPPFRVALEDKDKALMVSRLYFQSTVNPGSMENRAGGDI